jgi:hypothetical protein
VGKNTTAPFIDFTTNGLVDTGNGFANIKAVGTDVTDITLTPHTSSSFFDGLFFRGQIRNTPGGTGYNGTLTATITDILGHQFIDTWTGIKPHADFSLRGFDEIGVKGDAIKSVALSVNGTGGYFFQLKQLNASDPHTVSVTPLPASWTMMLIGFAGLGFIAYRQRKQSGLRAA